ncbi:MAG: ATP-dependent DNA helicase RecG [Candidatus Stahlbacteria bacterium]|nr:MAG: ATP-dependent DNA helicase RecG [Candidatus Stahlbacteria bacterium]
MVKKTYLKLDSQVQYIKGIGPKRSLYFKKIGVETINDLLFLVPRRYIDYSDIFKIKNLKINNEATVIGKIQLVELQKIKNRVNLTKILLTDDSGSINIKWFNRPDLKKKFKVGDWLLISGKVSFFYDRQFVNPLYEIISEEEIMEKTHGSIIPVYPLTDGLSLWDIKRAIKISLDACLDEIRETLPQSITKKHNLMSLSEAVYNLHFPTKIEKAIAARRRLVYDEFFFFELILAKRKMKFMNETGIPLKENGKLTEKFVRLLPFQLTKGQTEVIKSIVNNMEQLRPMNRLLQGDVGSGKTIVALYAMLVSVENGYQSVLMAPTEILAEQHFIVLSEILKKLNVESLLLTSSIKGDERQTTIQKIHSGEAQIIFGTHALIEEEIMFKNLGLAVVDEQHRFGVMQRAALVNKGINPDFLVLSATPIPRTIALTLYGDLDISMLKEKPPSRGEVITKIVNEKKKGTTFEFVRQEVSKGRQVFVICPIIEKSEILDLKSVNEVYQEITGAFPECSVGVIHGRLKTAERMSIMNEFRCGNLSILVATTVIEVGVDIPNASVMLIEHPERFGLAQLHQLRGRIGRGAQKSYCFLFLNRYVPPETFERISFFEKNNDGFALAQKDIKLRGPGEILGKKQHGLPDIKIGDLEADKDLLFLARDDAFELVKKDPEISSSEYYVIRRKLNKLAKKAQLLRIG